MRTTMLCLSTLLASTLSLGQDLDVPLHNWTVPPFTQSSTGGIHAMTDATPPRAFVAIVPCRIADTRGNGAPIQGGIFANSEARNWSVWGSCGIPISADAISVNFTVVSPPGTPQGAFLLAWPTGSPPVSPTALITYGPGVTVISNAAIVPLSIGGGQLTINVSHSTHIIMDVNGYFSETLGNQSAGFRLENAGFGATASFQNSDTGCSGTCAVSGITNSISSGRAIGGLAPTGTTNSAGVYGRQGGQFFMPTAYGGAGIRGESHSLGVLGITNTQVAFGVGASGSLLNSNGTAALAEGYLGYYTGSSFGVYSYGNAHVQGTLTATTKSFVQPHPHDASKEIQYVSLEGPHSEVYFRGTAQISQGVTRIAIPDHFRFVADAATYSTLVTPVGGMATVAVLSEGPNGITVRASRNVKIHYVVYAEREAVRNPDPIVENIHFRPNPKTDFLGHLPDSFVDLMISNGTLNPDRTVNQETVRRLGWEVSSDAPLRAITSVP